MMLPKYYQRLLREAILRNINNIPKMLIYFKDKNKTDPICLPRRVSIQISTKMLLTVNQESAEMLQRFYLDASMKLLETWCNIVVSEAIKSLRESWDLLRIPIFYLNITSTLNMNDYYYCT